MSDSDSQIKKMALQLSLGEREIQAAVELLDSGASLPFIARYRKEATGNLDEVAIARIRDLLFSLRQLEERRKTILHSLAKRNQLTDSLQEKLLAADTLARLEDIYLPFRPKRKTRAAAAKERGLEPLAKMIFAQKRDDLDPEKESLTFVNPEKGVASANEALAGARDIMAEWMSEDAEARCKVRSLYQTRASSDPWLWLLPEKKKTPQNTGITWTGPNLSPEQAHTGCWPCCGERELEP